MSEHIPPSHGMLAFHCIHCDVLAKQEWYVVGIDRLDRHESPRDSWEKAMVESEPHEAASDHILSEYYELKNRFEAEQPAIAMASLGGLQVVNASFVRCSHCNGLSFWVGENLEWPSRGAVPIPNPDLDEPIKKVYEEAGSILDRSPRGAAALLRLAIQMLCKQLNEKGENINEDIKSLIKQGLPARIQQALDIVRVTGNNAVHPGTMNLDDDRKTASQLFTLVNLIAHDRLTQPQLIQELFNDLPQTARHAIQKRDAT
jgi:hypothetical protein